MNKKSKILFTIGILDNGGVAKSLLSLLSVIDKERYDVELLIAGHDCGNNEDVPQGVKVYTDKTLADVVGGAKGLKSLLCHGQLLLFLASIVRLLLSRINRGWAGWWLAQIMPVITNEEYDLIVDYNGQHMLYYMVGKLHAAKKVTFFHSDYKKWRHYENMDRKYYRKVDCIFTISEICVTSLKDIFPESAEKVALMENISSPQLIEQKSKAAVEWKRSHRFVLLSLGHVCIGKGSDIAMKVALTLRDREIDYEWLFLGDLADDMDYKGFVKENGLQNRVIFLGNVKNPYPYIREADLFVHLSRFEGRSIALDEAKLMCKPVVVSNFSSVGDQFKDGVNGSICEMNSESATEKITEILNNNDLVQKYISQLKAERYDNSTEVEKIYKLLG